MKSSARIFDPIGFLIPFMMRVKCLFQEMWRRGIRWDKDLPGDLSVAWQHLCPELPQVHQIFVPRCRLVRSVKACLKTVMGKASLRFEELTYLLSEVEATIKSWKFTSHGTSATDSSSFPDREETFLLTTKALH